MFYAVIEEKAFNITNLVFKIWKRSELFYFYYYFYFDCNRLTLNSNSPNHAVKFKFICLSSDWNVRHDTKKTTHFFHLISIHPINPRLSFLICSITFKFCDTFKLRLNWNNERKTFFQERHASKSFSKLDLKMPSNADAESNSLSIWGDFLWIQTT